LRFSLPLAVAFLLSICSLSFAAERTLLPVPYHSQIGEGNPLAPNNWCTVACMNMVFDYYEEVPGSPFCQPEIAMVTNTDDVAGGFFWRGTQASDARRGCHFSVLSLSIYGGLHGYSWRPAGFSALDTTWQWTPSELKNILDLGYPVIIHSTPGPLDSVYREDGSPFGEVTDTTEIGHSRVLVGYDDTLSPPIFIMHDPYSPGPQPVGAFVWCTQNYFWTRVWAPGSPFLFTAPWEIEVEKADTFDMNDTVSVKARVRYTCPPPLAGLFPLDAEAVLRLVLPPGIYHVAGDSSDHYLAGINSGGDVDSTEWVLVTADLAVDDSLLFNARGLLSSASVSYSLGYMDSVGSSCAVRLEVADISPPEVSVLFPDGGEVLQGGVTDSVWWWAADNVSVDTVTVLLSTDGGSSWDTLARGEPNDSSCAVVLPPVNEDSCMVRVLAFDPALNMGADTSDSLFSIRTDLLPPAVTVIYPNGGENLVGGAEDSVRWVAFDSSGVDSLSIFISTDQGATWDTLATGEQNDSVAHVIWPLVDCDECMLEVRAFDPQGFQGADTSDSFFGIHATGVLERQRIPSFDFYMGQPSPNPFARSTSVQFSVGREGRGLLKVLDSSGRTVRETVLPRVGVDRISSYVWDGSDERGAPVPSGVYFISLVSGKRTANVKVVLLR
jgi:hypothetical protein